MSRAIGVTEFLSGLVPPWALPVVLAATTLAEAPILVSLVAYRYWFGDREAGLRLLAIAATALAVLLAAKHAFGLPRPPASMRVPVSEVAAPFDVVYADLLDTDESGFPSGHTTLAAAVYGGAAMDAARNRRRWLAVAGALTLVVGFSRVFLAVHFLADVVGGVLLGAGIVAAMHAADRWLDAPAGSLALGAGASTVAVAVVPGETNAVAGAGAVVGAAVTWLAVDVPAEPWSVSRAVGKRALAAVAVAAVAAAPLLAVGTNPVLTFAVAVVATGATVAIPGFDPEDA